MTSPALRIVFAGTPDFAAQHLNALIASHHQVVAVYCPPDKPAGRGKKLTPCETKILAQQHHIPVEQPISLKAQEQQQILQSYQADVMVVVAYGLLLPEPILTTPRLGCINVHGSILPKWRGAAPIQRAIEAGDKESGVTIMQMDKGLDTGAMIYIEKCLIAADETAASLYQKLADIGPKALLTTLDLMASGNYSATQQNNDEATYAHKLTKQEAELDWHLPATVLERKIRAYNAWPMAYFSFQETEKKQHKIKVWQAEVINTENNAQPGTILAVDKSGITVATADKALKLIQLQPPGKKPMAVADILNGRANWFVTGQLITGKLSGEC